MPPQHHKARVKTRLRSFLPKAGFILPPRAKFLHRRRIDFTVIEFLRDHGGCTNLQNGVHSSPRQQIDTALATMFREGSRAIEEDKRILQKNSTIDFVALLRPSVAFAFPCAGDMSLHEDIFIELFIELLSARRAWWASPRMPFDYGQHGELARAIDEFDLATGDDWKNDDPDAALFTMTVSDPTAPGNQVDETDAVMEDMEDGEV